MDGCSSCLLNSRHLKFEQNLLPCSIIKQNRYKKYKITSTNVQQSERRIHAIMPLDNYSNLAPNEIINKDL